VRLAWLAIATMAAAVPLKDCGTVKVDGPKTPQCPEGRYIVTYDESQNPPLVNYRCEKPAASPSPGPAPSPSPVPSVMPSLPPPQPSPSVRPMPSTAPPSPSATPPASPSPGGLTDACPAPYAVKLGFGQNPRALNPGFANTASITPLVANTQANRQPCAYRGLTGPEDTCPADEGCADHVGAPYQVAYGQPQALQDGPGFRGDPVERTTDGCNKDDPGVVPCGYNLRFATGGRENYLGGRYNEAGPMRICASMPNLPTWRCQTGTMGDDGKLNGFGTDSHSTDVPK
jgi:hypothetical protein